MANDPLSDEPPVELSEPVREWLGRLAAEEDVAEEELLGRLLDGADTGVDESTVDRQLDAVESSLRGRIDEVDAEYQAKLEDVRNRVIQVKRETDAKAPADHAHERLERRVESLGKALDSLETTIEDTTERFEAGFQNYEDVLEYLTESADAFDRKLDTLATAVVDLRDRFETIERYQARQQILDQVTAAANRHSIRRAVCDSCDRSVEIALLVEPRCPYCAEPVTDVDPGRRFFGTHRLVTGAPSALDGDVAGDPADLESTLDDFGRGAPPTPEAAGSDDRVTVSSPGGDGLEAIDGIGSAYAERLTAAGVSTVADLADADAGTLADATGISVSRIDRWIDHASEQTGH